MTTKNSADVKEKGARSASASEPMEVQAFSIKRAAAYLGISPEMVRRLVYSRELPSLRIRRRRLIQRSDLEAFLRQQAEAGEGF